MIAGMEDGSNAIFRTASEYPLPTIRNLVDNELELVHPDGTTQAIAATYSGGNPIADNAGNINDVAAPGVTVWDPTPAVA